MQLTQSFPRTRVAAIWIIAMAWHLWRIATLRPAFALLADDQKTVASFASLFLVAGLMRHWMLGPSDLMSALGGLGLYALLLLILFERSHRASTLFAACLGISVLFDVLMVVLEISGAAPGIGQIHAVSYAEVGVMFLLRHAFLKQPAAVQSRGYKPPREAA